LREDNLKNFFSGDNSMVVFNQNHEGKVIDYVENVENSVPRMKRDTSDDLSIKEFDEKDMEYEAEINRTTPSHKYK
jgi:hypothetical protein